MVLYVYVSEETRKYANTLALIAVRTNELRAVEESTVNGKIDTRTTGCLNPRDSEPANKVVEGKIDDTCLRTGRGCRSIGTTPGNLTSRIANLLAELDETKEVDEKKKASATGVGLVGTEVVHAVKKCGYEATSREKSGEPGGSPRSVVALTVK